MFLVTFLDSGEFPEIRDIGHDNFSDTGEMDILEIAIM